MDYHATSQLLSYLYRNTSLILNVYEPRSEKNIHRVSDQDELKPITKTRPCNIQRFFTAVKMTIFS